MTLVINGIGTIWPIHGELSVNLIRPPEVEFKLAAAILFLGAVASSDFLHPLTRIVIRIKASKT
jgi:hypothetical protein